MNITVTPIASVGVERREFAVYEPSDTKNRMLTLSFLYHADKPVGLEISCDSKFSKTARYKYIATETAIFNLIKTALNQLSRRERFLATAPSHYASWVKKKMWKDGHLTADHCYYVREQRHKGMTRMLAVHDESYAIRDLCVQLRTEGTVYLTVTDLLKGENNAN